MHHANHFISCDLERRTRVDSRGGRQPQPKDGRERLFSNKVASRKERDCGLFASLRDDRDLCPAFLQIEDGVRLISLGEKVFFRFKFDNPAAKSGIGKKCDAVEISLVFFLLQITAPF